MISTILNSNSQIRLVDLDAILWQRDRMVELICDHNPALVVLEGMHYQKNVDTLKKLSGLLYVMRSWCADRSIEHVVMESERVMKSLHLAVGIDRGRKMSRTRVMALSVLYGNPHNAPDYDKPLDDECSAITLL